MSSSSSRWVSSRPTVSGLFFLSCPCAGLTDALRPLPSQSHRLPRAAPHPDDPAVHPLLRSDPLGHALCVCPFRAPFQPGLGLTATLRFTVWLAPNRQIRPPIYSFKQRSQRRAIVGKYAIVSGLRPALSCLWSRLTLCPSSPSALRPRHGLLRRPRCSSSRLQGHHQGRQLGLHLDLVAVIPSSPFPSSPSRLHLISFFLPCCCCCSARLTALPPLPCSPAPPSSALFFLFLFFFTHAFLQTHTHTHIQPSIHLSLVPSFTDVRARPLPPPPPLVPSVSLALSLSLSLLDPIQPFVVLL